ncbi:MAG: peptidoglycan bridge formation glycyltransferase FemA/FemB family protein, partial [Clostridia bacterium]|nr:peptidoglycan bridge formation glycyltransferase FemA/FemB family protein [Clostridia bacterium]
MWLVGPVCDLHNGEILKDLKEGADELAKKYKAFVLRMEPDVEKDDQKFREIVTDLGFKIKDDSKDFKDEIQPRFVFQLDLRGKDKDTIFSEFQSKTRYNVRLATKKGVEIKEG